MSSIEIRRVDYDEAPTTTLPLQAYAFQATPIDPEELERERQWQAGLTDNDRLAAFEDGQAVAVVVGRSMRQNLRGTVVPMLGVSGVAAHPAFRRKGHVRTLLDRLHAEKKAEGFTTAALWPFRATFYERFGYVGLPKPRKVRLHPAGFDSLRRMDLPGEIQFAKLSESLDDFVAYHETLMTQRHGVALFGRERLRADAGHHDRWVAYARVDGKIAGLLAYRTDGFAKELRGDKLLASTPTARMLLLRWLAGHLDQQSSFTFTLPPDERPDLWHTDVVYDDLTVVAAPDQNAPMARILSMEGLSGMSTGRARAVIEVVDDPFVKGIWTLDGTSGTLEVSPGSGTGSGASGSDPTSLTSHGLAAIAYGVLNPEEVNLRGYGRVSLEAGRALTTLFPENASPYLYSSF